MSTGNSLEVATSTVVCFKNIIAVQTMLRVLLSVGGCHEVQFQNRKKKPHSELVMYIRNQKLFSKISSQNGFKKGLVALRLS